MLTSSREAPFGERNCCSHGGPIFYVVDKKPTILCQKITRPLARASVSMNLLKYNRGSQFSLIGYNAA